MWTMANKIWEIKGGKKTVQLASDEAERLNLVLKRIQQRPRAKAASFNQALKELLGVVDYGLVTKKDRLDLLPPTNPGHKPAQQTHAKSIDKLESPEPLTQSQQKRK